MQSAFRDAARFASGCGEVVGTARRHTRLGSETQSGRGNGSARPVHDQQIDLVRGPQLFDPQPIVHLPG
jgi:hypothetical protein